MLEGLWELLRIALQDLGEVAGEREVWGSLLRILPHDLTTEKRGKMDGDGRSKLNIHD